MESRDETFVTYFDKARRDNPTKECYVAYDGNLKRTAMTFEEVWTLSCRYAYILKQHGLKRGDHVIVTTPLSLEYTVASLGVLLAGGCHIAMIKVFAECQMLRQAMMISKSKFLILDNDAKNETWDYFKGHAQNLSREGMSADFYDGVHFLEKILFTPKFKGSWKDGFLDHLRQCTKEFTDTGLTSQDAAIVCASLSLGITVPKVVERTHGALIQFAKTWVKHLDFSTGHNIHTYFLPTTLPFDVLFGRTLVISDLLVETPITDMAMHMVQVARAEKLTNNFIMPSDLCQMVDAVQVRANGGQLPVFKDVLTGGMPMTSSFIQRARQLTENLLISYVGTEIGVVTINRLGPGDEFVPFDSGLPFGDAQIRIVNEEFENVPMDQTGRILLKSPTLFSRYVGEPDRDKAAWTDDGWFITEDAGRLGSNGHLLVYGRMTDTIPRGVLEIHPAWLEKPIALHPEVKQVTVVGVSDPITYKKTCACVVKQAGSQLTEETVLELVRNDADGSDLFILDYVVFFDSSLPRIPRDELGDMAARKLGLAM